MSLLGLLRELEDLGVQVWAEDGRIRYRGSQETLTPELLSRLRDSKAELLGLLAQEEDPILPAPRDGDLPLSFNQAQLWLLAQLKPTSGAYNEAAELELEGDLHLAALHQALQEIVRRHEVLRTTFPSRRGQPYQQVAPTWILDLPLVDLIRLSPEERTHQLRRLETQAARRPFDLVVGPLLRLLLVRRGSREHVLQIILHHLIHDGESMKVLAAELAELYGTYREGRSSSLPEPKIQYADFAVWQRRRVRGDLLRREQEYWRGRMEGAEEVLMLPFDGGRGKDAGDTGSRRSVCLTEKLTAAARRFAADQGSTLYMVLLAGWFALLHRLTGQQRISVGVPRSGRLRSSLEGMLGFVVNTQVLVAEVSPSLGFAGLLDQVREAVLGAEAHGELPFQLLLEELRPQRHEGVHPLFQVMFAFQEDPRDAVRLPGLDLRLRQLGNGSAKFDLDFSLVDEGQRVEGYLEYPSGLFHETTIEGFLALYQRLLTTGIKEPRQPVTAFDLLREEERRGLLELGGSNDSATPPATLHGLFRQWAQRTPAAPALTTDAGTLTYGALDSLTDRLAGGLLRRGLRLGGRAALLLDDPRSQVLALLAVLKAGGVFVFVDPSVPEPRRLRILEEAGADLVLDRDFMEEVLESSRESASAQEELPVVSPEFPAYLAFTSGSTGRPKGILQTHRSFGQFLVWQAREFGFEAGTRLCQWATSTYDAAYCEILGALCFGATLCAPPRQTRHDPRRLVDWLERERVTALQVVPSFFRQLLGVLKRRCGEEGIPGDLLPDLETVLLAGEVLAGDLVRGWAGKSPGAPPIFNLYGPSEIVLATWFDTRELGEDDATAAIGRPIEGRQVILLDSSSSLCPRGCMGRIFVRSQFLTLGYFGRPRETAESYLPDPFSDRPGERIYSTGDLGRWSVRGVLEFHGRADQQVKVRGMRVDLREVESVLCRYPGVSECAVDLQGPGGLTRYIAAFLVVDGDLDQEALRAFSQLHLPQHMVPAVFPQLPALPRTTTGKIDRRALPTTEVLPSNSGSQAPRTPLEARVASWWCEELKVGSVGVTDNFFSLGGNSLLAVQLAHRISEETGVDLTLAELLENPTVAGAALRVEQRQKEEQDRTAQLLEQVQELSDQEVERLLALEEAQALDLKGDGA